MLRRASSSTSWIAPSFTPPKRACRACGPARLPSSCSNRAPANGLPAYATIRDVGGRVVDSTTNEVLLTVYGTRGARLQVAALDDVPVPIRSSGPDAHVSTFSEAGLPAWQIQLSLPREQPRRLVLQLLEPAVKGEPRVPEQPLARPLLRDVRVAPCR